jgi:hypothetical protein
LKLIYPGYKSCLLYTDDTLLFIKPELQQIRILKSIMQIFAKISELTINMQKLEILITSSSREHVQELSQIMQYKAPEFQLKYIGLPLSDRSLSRQHY